MLHLLQAAHDAAPSVTPLQAAVGTLIIGAGQALQWWTSHHKGKAGKQENAQTLKRIEKKLDDFINAQHATNHDHDKRIDEVSAHVIGPDGENGLRSRVKKIEDRISTISALRPT